MIKRNLPFTIVQSYGKLNREVRMVAVTSNDTRNLFWVAAAVILVSAVAGAFLGMYL